MYLFIDESTSKLKVDMGVCEPGLTDMIDASVSRVPGSKRADEL